MSCWLQLFWVPRGNGFYLQSLVGSFQVMSNLVLVLNFGGLALIAFSRTPVSGLLRGGWIPWQGVTAPVHSAQVQWDVPRRPKWGHSAKCGGQGCCPVLKKQALDLPLLLGLWLKL